MGFLAASLKMVGSASPVCGQNSPDKLDSVFCIEEVKNHNEAIVENLNFVSGIEWVISIFIF